MRNMVRRAHRPVVTLESILGESNEGIYLHVGPDDDLLVRCLGVAIQERAQWSGQLREGVCGERELLPRGADHEAGALRGGDPVVDSRLGFITIT